MNFTGKRLSTIALAGISLIGVATGGRMLAGLDPVPAFVGGASVAEAGDHPFGIGDDVKTSFGYIAIEHGQAISGLADKDLTGAHGVPHVVKGGTISVQLGATLTNLSKKVLHYTPEQYELLDGKGNVIPLARATKLPGELQPDAAIDIKLDYTTTTDARPFTIRFVDPETKQPLLISLGNVGCTVQSGAGRPLQVEGGCDKVPPAEDHGGHGGSADNSTSDTTGTSPGSTDDNSSTGDGGAGTDPGTSQGTDHGSGHGHGSDKTEGQ